MIVVIHHVLLTSPALADVYLEDPNVHGPAWVMTNTPLHLLWAGPEAVSVFFVLSGLVLTLPFVSAARRWRAYYAGRFVRLYVPVWASVVLAVALASLVQRTVSDDHSWWLNAHAERTTLSVLVHEVTLVFGTFVINSPLWSLRWEVLFSLGLPLYVWVARRVPATINIAVAVLVAAVGIGVHSLFLTHMPAFAIGASLAFHGREVPSRVLEGARGPVLLGCACLCLVARWWVPEVPDAAGYAISLLAATVIVLVFMRSEAIKAVTSTRGVTWLGKRSFSLYLVHEPIVVSVALLAAPTSVLLTLAVSLPVSLAVAAVFFVLVEERARRWAGVLSRRAVEAERVQLATT